MNTQPDVRLMYWHTQYLEALKDHDGGKREPDLFRQKLEQIETECREIFGSEKPFYDYIGKNP